MNRELISVIEQIGREKGIDKELLFEAVVDVELEIKQERPPQDLGRIAAQTAKQVILQKVRDAEREGIYSEFAGKEGQILRGIVHRIEKRNVILEIGKAEAILPEREQIPGERYNPGDRIRAYVLEVRRTAKGPQISLSRTHPGYLTRLFQTEIPEIQEGIVLVKATAREAGERAKVAVASTKRDVDPIGACVGLRGTRIQVISRELRGEKIDIIEWSHDPATFVAHALNVAGSCNHSMMSIFSPRNSRLMTWIRVPRSPTQAPIGSTSRLVEATATFARSPASRAVAFTRTMPSWISGISVWKRRAR